MGVTQKLVRLNTPEYPEIPLKNNYWGNSLLCKIPYKTY